MKAVCQEQERLEALAKRLHSLSSGSDQELVRMKEQRHQLREELEQKEARHGESLRPARDNLITFHHSHRTPAHPAAGYFPMLCCVKANMRIGALLNLNLINS